MNKRDRRELYLSTRRPADYLEKRAKWQKANNEWKALCSRYDIAAMTVEERYDILVKEGFVPASVPLSYYLERKWEDKE